MKFTKRDFWFSVATGLIAGFLAWRVFDFLGVPQVFGVSYASLVIIIPILWIAGVNLGYILGRWFGFFNQFGKFAAIGFTNAAVDFGVLNWLISTTGIADGGWFSVFKAISFISAVIPSFFWNKYWAFYSGDQSAVVSGGFQFVKFVSVAVVAIIVNDVVASIVVNSVDPLFELDAHAWANIGAVAGSAIALIFSFAGFKLAVFRNRN